jgi:uncharacterized protein (TIGR02117 family)
MTDYRKVHHNFMLLIFPLLFGGCLSPVQGLYPEKMDERTVPLYIVSHGWHAGIAIESEYIRHLLPEHSAIPDSELLKFGWGDYRYYSEPDAGFWLMLRAAMIPTRSTLHVVGIEIPIERYFFNSRIIRIQITTEGAENLGRFISERFYRDSDGDVQFQSDGLYSNSAFFRAKGLYYMPKTSNIWTARALRKTGYPITPIYGLTSGNVMKQASKDGVWIRE